MAARTFQTIVLGRRVRAVERGGNRFIEATYGPGTRFTPHAHERANITLILRGHLEETVARDIVHSSSYSLVIKPAGTVHANRFGPQGAHTFLIEPSSRWDGQMRQWRWFHGGPVAAAGIRLFRACRDNAPNVDDLLIDLLEVSDAPSGRRGHVSIWLDRVRNRIHDEFPARVPVETLAGELGVHPVYLARAFRARFGCSITEYAQRLRVHAAADHIASSAAPLAQVALHVGCADQPHLCRVFKRDTGVSPAQYRRLAAASQV